MIYGRPPFHSLGMLQKIQAIPDPSYEIKFPEYAIPIILGNAETPDRRLESDSTKVPVDVINSIRLCLVRDPKKRATIPQLLSQAWITGNVDGPSAVPLPRSPTVQKPLLKEDESIISQVGFRQMVYTRAYHCGADRLLHRRKTCFSSFATLARSQVLPSLTRKL